MKCLALCSHSEAVSEEVEAPVRLDITFMASTSEVL